MLPVHLTKSAHEINLPQPAGSLSSSRAVSWILLHICKAHQPFCFTLSQGPNLFGCLSVTTLVMHANFLI